VAPETENPARVTSRSAERALADDPKGVRVSRALLGRLTPSAMRALGRAYAFRGDRRRSRIHMEHLLVGLYEEDADFTKAVFRAAGISDLRALAMILSTLKVDVPLASPHDPKALAPSDTPVFSRHAASSFTNAAKLADKTPRLRPRILIIDSAYGGLKDVGAQLTDAGYQVTFAADGTSAPVVVEQNPPDVILFGEVSRDTAGALLRLKQDTSLAVIPVIAFTASERSQFRIEGLDLGADEYVPESRVRRVTGPYPRATCAWSPCGRAGTDQHRAPAPRCLRGYEVQDHPGATAGRRRTGRQP
jgi:CheY-like chemotaxis protein